MIILPPSRRCAPTFAGGGGGGAELLHGQTFELTAGGYGTRSDFGGAREYLGYHDIDWHGVDFSNMEAGLEQDGMNLNSSAFIDKWDWVSSATIASHSPRYDRWVKRFNNQPDPDNSNVQYLRSSDNHSTGKFLAYVWHYNTPTANGKTVRFWHDSGSSTDFWVNMGGPNVASDGPQSFTDTSAYSGTHNPKDTWFPMLYLIQDSDLSTTETIRLFKTGANSNNAIYTKGRTDYPVQTLCNPGLGAGEDGNDTDTFWGFSRAYIDCSWQTVWLTDHATWASRTKADPQRLLSWSDGSIQIRGKCDSFTMGQTAYLHVMDGNFAPIGSALQVTIGN